MMTTGKLMFFTVAAAAALFSQEAVGQGAAGVRAGTFEAAVPAPPPHGMAAPMAVEFIGAGFGEAGRVVKGAPYSADAVTESTQILADGNRISHRNSTPVYRDSEGRTRREAAFGGVPFAVPDQAPKLVFLNDPVSGNHYVLDMKARTVSRSKIAAAPEGLRILRHSLEAQPEGPARLEVRHEAGAAGAVAMAGGGHTLAWTARTEAPAMKTESLGRRTIEGVAADGTRTVATIAAGRIGNERPIEIVHEQWHSPELQVLLLSRHSDPRTGESVYKLTNISRGDPPRSLFEPPADFKEAEGRGDVIRMRVPATPAVRPE